MRSRGGTTDSCPSYLMEICSLQTDLRVGASSRLLREVQLSIIRHEECNQILKDKTGNIFTITQEGVVCGYSEKGGDTCQVSSRVSCHTAPAILPSEVPNSQTSGPGLCPHPPFTVSEANGLSGQAATAPGPAWQDRPVGNSWHCLQWLGWGK